MRSVIPEIPVDLFDAYALASVPGFYVRRAFDHPYVVGLDHLGDDALRVWLEAHAAPAPLTYASQATAAAIVVALAKRGTVLPTRMPQPDWMYFLWAAARRRAQDVANAAHVDATPAP